MRSLFLTFLVVFQINSVAAEQFTVSGRLLDEQHQPIKNASININKTTTTTNQKGFYTLSLANSDIYQVAFKKIGFYSSIHSYSHAELSAKKSSISDVVLVAKKDQRVMLAFGGDVMMGRRYYQPYFGDEVLIHLDNKLADSKAIVEHIKPYMHIADYAAVNLESQIATTKPPQRAPKSVTFYSQPEILAALEWAGIDYVTLGNNHTYDYLDSGLHSTLSALKSSSLGYSGAGKNEQESLTAHHQTINNNDFSMLGYVGWEGSADPTQTANKSHGGAAYGSMENILESVSREVSNNKTTIVQYHGSQEYANEPTGVTEQRLKSALDAGAALAVAHHPHVSQGLELYNGKLIAYSMGNFIFDQNFSATQHSFMLYVWLDQGQFYRAEIVPIYVKGYKPTPAVGIQRNTLMRRLTSLSQQRNTFISNSGGHGVITAENSPATKVFTKATVRLANNEKATSLYHLPWTSEVNTISLPDKNLQYRLGTNLINNSDFENFTPFNSPERGFMFNRATSSINNFGFSGQYSLGLAVESSSKQLFGMQSFRRVYKASNPMTIKSKLLINQAITVNVYWQGRKTRQKLFDAFENSPKHLIATKSLNAQDTWQSIEVDFNSPRIGYKSYRVLLEFENNSGEVLKVNIDDFSLIEWQSAFTSKAAPLKHHLINGQATFIGLNKQTDKEIVIEYSNHQF